MDITPSSLSYYPFLALIFLLSVFTIYKLKYGYILGLAGIKLKTSETPIEEKAKVGGKIQDREPGGKSSQSLDRLWL